MNTCSILIFKIDTYKSNLSDCFSFKNESTIGYQYDLNYIQFGGGYC